MATLGVKGCMQYVFSQLPTPKQLEVPVPAAEVAEVLNQQVNHSDLQYGILR